MIKLREADRGEIVFTGPIDQFCVEDPGLPCPGCGEVDFFHYYPEQRGPCHSGLFINKWGEHYGCDECGRDYVEAGD